MFYEVSQMEIYKKRKTLSLVDLVARFSPLVYRWATDCCVIFLSSSCHYAFTTNCFFLQDFVGANFPHNLTLPVLELGEEQLYCASLRPSCHASLSLSTPPLLLSAAIASPKVEEHNFAR